MMEYNETVAVFESKQIRRYYDSVNEEWYFSVIDVVSILTDSSNPRDYWFKMKIQVKLQDGVEPSTFCRQFIRDEKMKKTDSAYLNF